MSGWRPCAVVCAAALACAGCGRLDRDAVQTDVSSVASAAAEGALVAHEVERGRTLRSFAVIRTAELHKVAMNAGKALQQTPVEQGLGHGAARGVQIADQVAGALDALHRRPEDRALARRVRLALDRLATQAGDVADAL